MSPIRLLDALRSEHGHWDGVGGRARTRTRT